MEIVGFCTIKKDATTIVSPISINNFQGKDVRVLEFTDDGDVMVVDAESLGIATVDKKDILRSFRCGVMSKVIIPPDINIITAHNYVYKCLSRKGGYNDTLANMVIVASLSKGTFTDDFLWQKQ